MNWECPKPKSQLSIDLRSLGSSVYLNDEFVLAIRRFSCTESLRLQHAVTPYASPTYLIHLSICFLLVSKCSVCTKHHLCAMNVKFRDERVRRRVVSINWGSTTASNDKPSLSHPENWMIMLLVNENKNKKKREAMSVYILYHLNQFGTTCNLWLVSQNFHFDNLLYSGSTYSFDL